VQPAVLKVGTGGHDRLGSLLAGGEVLGIGGVGELLAHQAGQEQQRAAWPVVRHDVLGLSGGVAGDQDDTADGLAADLSGVVLKPAVVAVGAGEVELWWSYSVRMVTTIVRTACAPCAAPSNSE